MVTYKLGLTLSTKIFNFNHFVNTLDFDEFLLNPDILPCKGINAHFADKYHKHVVIGDLRIIDNNHWRKLFTKGPKFIETKTINHEKAKSCILTGLNDCINDWCNENGISKSFFSEWSNSIKNKINNRIKVLNNKLHKCKQFDALSSPDIRAELENVHKYFVVVPIDKVSGNIELICKRLYASVIAKELGLGNNNTTDRYNSINNSSTDTIINSNINDLKSKFGIDDVNIENHCLPHMYWLPKMHKSPIKARFIIASPKSSIKPLSRAITSAFCIFHRQIESYDDKCRFLSGVNTFWVVQNNKPITDAIN